MAAVKMFKAAVIASILMQVSVATFANAETQNSHHFDIPYQCDREREVTSSSTGETRTVQYRTVYFPQRDWRLVLIDVWADKSALGDRGVANLYTPNFRYDGVYRDDGNDITSISLSSAWSKEDRSPGVSLRSSKDDDIQRCAPLNDEQIAFYTLDYLEDLEIIE